MNLKVDPKFRDLIPPLTADEERILEENILLDGEVYEPIIVWEEKNVIIDGHHRWEIIQKYPELLEKRFKVKYIPFPNEYAAMAWACNNQLGRRNLTDAQKTYLIGKRLDNEKAAYGGDRKSETAKSRYQNGNLISDTEPEPPRGRTAERLAKEYGVGQGTVNRAADFARGVDIADEIEPGIKDSVLSGEIKVPKSTIQQISRAEPEQQEQAVKYIMDGKPDDAKEILSKTTSAKNKSEEDSQTKVCSMCGKKLPISEFYKDRNSTRSECKKCHNLTSHAETSVTGRKFGISPEYRNLSYDDIVGNLNGEIEVAYTDWNFVEELNAIFEDFEKSVQRHFHIHENLEMSGECKRSIAARMTEARTKIEKWEDEYCE